MLGKVDNVRILDVRAFWETLTAEKPVVDRRG
jgi:hypothetical protein